jgi:phytoene dehydrogenase-like protein
MRLSMTQLLSPWTCGAQLAHLLTLVRWEGYSAPGGLVTIRNLLLERIRERGGVLIEADEMRELHIKRGNVTAFGLHGSEFSEVGCTAVVVAGNPRGFIALAPEERRMKQWRKELDRLPVRLRKAYQMYRLSPEGVPIGMKAQGLIVPATRPGGESAERRRYVRAIRYAIRRKMQEGKAPEVWIGLTAFLPVEGEPEPARVREEIREGLLQAVPFLDRHLLAEPSELFLQPMEGIPGDFSQGFLYGSDDPRTLGAAGLTPETPFNNVFTAGDMIFPGLGLDGELIAGLQCSHYVGNLIHEDKQLAD